MVMRQDRTSPGDFSRPPWTWTEEDLNDLVASQRKEDWHVEYKNSDLLTDKNRSIKELTKAVSAFSNGDGGVIVIGVREAKKGKLTYPEELDSGAPSSEFTTTWLVQVIQSNVDPAITDLRVSAVPLSGERQGNVAFVIYVPAGNRAVQASDLRYYQRIEDQSAPMKGFQIRDVNNRAEGADLRLSLRFRTGHDGRLISAGEGLTKQIVFDVVARNLADIAAELAMFRIVAPKELNPSKPNYWEEGEESPEIYLRYKGGTCMGAATMFERYYYSPESAPIFRGLAGIVIGTFGLTFHDQYQDQPHLEPVVLIVEGLRMEPRFQNVVLAICGSQVTIEDSPEAEIVLNGVDPRTYFTEL